MLILLFIFATIAMAYIVFMQNIISRKYFFKLCMWAVFFGIPLLLINTFLAASSAGIFLNVLNYDGYSVIYGNNGAEEPAVSGIEQMFRALIFQPSMFSLYSYVELFLSALFGMAFDLGATCVSVFLALFIIHV